MKHEYAAGFLQWFRCFPNSAAKYEAWLEWEKQGLEGREVEMIKTLAWQIKCRQLSMGTYCPHARRYLHGRRFEDEPPQKRESEPTPIAETLPRWMEAKQEQAKGWDNWSAAEKAELKWKATK